MSAIVIKTRRTGCQVFIENDGLSAKLRVSGCSTGPLNRAEALTIADALTDGRLETLIRAARAIGDVEPHDEDFDTALLAFDTALLAFRGEFEP